MTLTSSLTPLILDQSSQCSVEMLLCREDARSSVGQMRRLHLNSEADFLKPELPDDLCYTVLLAQENGAFSWLTSLLILEHRHALHNGAFHNALVLQYGWLPSDIPSECVSGALSYQRGLSYHAP